VAGRWRRRAGRAGRLRGGAHHRRGAETAFLPSGRPVRKDSITVLAPARAPSGSCQSRCRRETTRADPRERQRRLGAKCELKLRHLRLHADVFTCRTTDFTCTYSPASSRSSRPLRGGKTSEAVIAASSMVRRRSSWRPSRRVSIRRRWLFGSNSHRRHVDGSSTGGSLRTARRLGRHRPSGCSGADASSSGRTGWRWKKDRLERHGGAGGVALLLVVLGPSFGELPAPDDEPQDLRGREGTRWRSKIGFDQATGKLSDEDYAMLGGTQALDALRAEDRPRPRRPRSGHCGARPGHPGTGFLGQHMPAPRAAARDGCNLLLHLRLRA
jgi:hypothetical protein